MASGPTKVTSTARAALILDTLAKHPAGGELGLIAREAAMSPSGAHRALQALIAEGLATQPSRGVYRLGPRVLNWASSMTTETALIAIADDDLRRINAALGETVMLSVVRDKRIWTIASFEGSGTLVTRLTAGPEPLFHSTARGLLALAHMPRSDAKALISAVRRPPVGSDTITDERVLWQTVDQVRDRGLAWNRTAVITGAAAPILDPEGQMIASIAMAAASVTLVPERMKEIEIVLRTAANQISAKWARETTWTQAGPRG